MVANALNRQCDLVPHIRESCSCKWFAWYFCGRDLKRESLIWPRANIRREVHLHISCRESPVFNFQGEISLGFAKKSCCSDSSDSDSESEDSVQAEDTENRAQGDDKKDFDFVLIYSAQGEHVKGHGKLVYNTDDNEDDAILKCTTLRLDELDSVTLKKIEKAYQAKTALLVHYGRGKKGHGFHACPDIYETVPGSACASITSDFYLLTFLLVAFLAFMFLEKLLFGNRGIEDALTDFSIYLLLLPSLVQVFMHNETHEVNIPHTGINETSAKREQELINVFSEGARCLYSGEQGNHWLRTFLAVSDSSAFYVGCGLAVLVTCWRMLRAKFQLRELNGLLQLLNTSSDEKDVHAMLLHRLYSIRSKVTRKGILKFAAKNDLPVLLKKDPTFWWWFATRAAIFQDLDYELTQRMPLMLLAFTAQVLLIVMTTLSHFDSFDFFCYSVMTGVILGSVMLAFFILGDQLNSMFEDGLNELARTNLQDPEFENNVGEDPPSPSSTGRSLSQTLDRVRRGHPLAATASETADLNPTLKRALQYELNHQLVLNFAGCKLNRNYVFAGASSLGTFCIPVIMEIWSKVSDHVFN